MPYYPSGTAQDDCSAQKMLRNAIVEVAVLFWTAFAGIFLGVVLSMLGCKTDLECLGRLTMRDFLTSLTIGALVALICGTLFGASSTAAYFINKYEREGRMDEDEPVHTFLESLRELWRRLRRQN